ncbi:hypothetical protein [Bacillus sp. PS06]|uniref:hypothetical protein n=1 Tax=Bacillus sp. PS06 TaxID=2764176 RepID=UPI0017824051|nr:hypothetical protein [Bacillus sp. PS06]MBD8067849.1 hypothetical protein [Bacillus sp. PS06]
MMNVLIVIALGLAVFFSFVAWLNTQTIIRDLTEIKAKLGIVEGEKSTFLDRDIDND